MGGKVFPLGLFPSTFSAHAGIVSSALYEGVTLNVAAVMDCFRFGVIDPLQCDLGFSGRIHPNPHARSGRGLS